MIEKREQEDASCSGVLFSDDVHGRLVALCGGALEQVYYTSPRRNFCVGRGPTKPSTGK